MSSEAIKVLDHGFVRFIEAWGHGDAGNVGAAKGVGIPDDYECGIIEAARQSTQASFRGWESKKCEKCEGLGTIVWPSEDGGSPEMVCPNCVKGKISGDQALLKSLYLNDPQHATPFEFGGMTIEIQAPIFVFREWHRHRTQSYNEASARYAPLPDVNYLPEWDVLKSRGEAADKTRNRQEKGTHPWDERGAAEWLVDAGLFYTECEEMYQQGLKAGVPKELARIVIPVGRYSRMRATANLRNWLAFMTLRCDPGAQWEIRAYASIIADIIKEKFPRTWALYVEKKSPEHRIKKFTDVELLAEIGRRGLRV